MYQALKLKPGILTLTYVTPAEGTADAMIRPVVPLGSRHALTLMFEPGNASGALLRPGEFCVIRCGQSTILGVEIEPLSGVGAPRGGIDLTYLSQRGPDPAASSTRVADYIVHLAGYGDRAARYGTWVGADAPDHPIAGLMVHSRAGVPKLVIQDVATGQTAAPGEFLGSVGAFRPLTDLRLWIDGPTGAHRLHVSADYELAGRLEAGGTMVSLTSAGPADKLLRLQITMQPMRATAGISQPASTGIRRGDRIQIFRKV